MQHNYSFFNLSFFETTRCFPSLLIQPRFV